MRKAFLSALACLACLAATPAAAQFTVSHSGTHVIGDNNDFKADLAGLGLTRYADLGSSVTATPGTFTFTLMAWENGYKNAFSAKSLAADVEWTGFSAWGSTPASFSYTSGDAAPGVWKLSTDGPGVAGLIGSQSLAIFLPLGAGDYVSNTLYFGFDDLGAGPDDNHDDGIFRVTWEPLNGAVPEPQTWAMLIAGFGMVGAASRRNRRLVSN